MITAYIAVGSNLADPVSQAKQAIEALKSIPNSEFVQASSLYSSTPMGPQNQTGLHQCGCGDKNQFDAS